MRADDRPFLGDDRLHREAEEATSDILARRGSALASARVTGFGKRRDRPDVDQHPGILRAVLRVGIGLPDHLDDADDRLALVGMVEEGLVALSSSPSC